MSAFIMVNA